MKTEKHEKQQLIRELSECMIRSTMGFRVFIRQKLKEHNVDLTFEMLQVLKVLFDKDGTNQQEIADNVMKDKASLTYLIDNLTRRGLVQREEDANDRRNKIVRLTAEGKALRRLIVGWVAEMHEAAARDITAEVLRDGIILFKKLQQNLSGCCPEAHKAAANK